MPVKRQVVLFPNQKLYERSKPVHAHELGNEFDAPWGRTTLKDLAADLIETMVASNGAGLAAIQIGVPLGLFVIASEKGVSDPLALVNPTWEPFDSAGKLVLLDEGCLSFPGILEQVQRWDRVTATYWDLDGKLYVRSFAGIPAQAVQHETEHLDGRLFIEHLPIHRRDRIRGKLKQAHRRTNAFLKTVKDDKVKLEK